jgi:hypothetical protein
MTSMPMEQTSICSWIYSSLEVEGAVARAYQCSRRSASASSDNLPAILLKSDANPSPLYTSIRAAAASDRNLLTHPDWWLRYYCETRCNPNDDSESFLQRQMKERLSLNDRLQRQFYRATHNDGRRNAD